MRGIARFRAIFVMARSKRNECKVKWEEAYLNLQRGWQARMNTGTEKRMLDYENYIKKSRGERL